MPTPVLATVKLGKKSGILGDRPTMDFAFSVADPLLTGITLAESALEAFFKVVPAGATQAIQSFLSPSLSTVGLLSQVSWYNLTGHLDGTPHGGPILTNSFTLSSLGTDPALPDQIACALSIHSDYGTDVEFGPGHTRPRASDRGRVFIGPLSANVIDDDATTHEPMLISTFRTTVAQAAHALLAAGVGWSVWSRKAAALKPVIGGWVDNRPDVQRRRAQAATTRTTWS